ncbi:hypothetical protein FOI42_RS02230 [Escherichia coli]|nr:hypothetical protein [Escherichia coli]MED6699122.1 hypothetical protein [Escherichia coli O157]USL83752.1 hypothetical protein A4_85 [Escherichia phage A4]HCQ0858860.1 hypothetical protein [Escherichia coli]
MSKHTTYRGTIIDMDMLKYQNQHQVALGNAKLNARGDKIGSGGTVIKTREELLQEKEREMQIPDYIPEHQAQSTDYSDDGWDDASFEVEHVVVQNEETVDPSVAPEEKKAPRRAKTKDQE